MRRLEILILVLVFVLTGTPVSIFVPTATAQSRTGWKTYLSTNLHLAVDYPPDWTVRTEDPGAVFSSPEGVTIRLQPGPPNSSDEIVQPNTRCSTAINPHGISVRTCSATIGAAIDAYLDLRSAGGHGAATISTRSRAILGTFNGLVESARIVP